jgi:hypothetical protein
MTLEAIGKQKIHSLRAVSKPNIPLQTKPNQTKNPFS